MKLITDGMLPAIKQVGELEDSGKLEPEQAGKIKKQITSSILQFLETGATIPEMYQEARFEPRLLMSTEPKLLAGTPDPEPELVEVEVEKQSAVGSLSAEELEQLRKLLGKAGKPQNKNDSELSEDSVEESGVLPDDFDVFGATSED